MKQESESHGEYYRRHRPKTFDDILGQDEVVKTLKSKLEKDRVPHVCGFFGPSGTGKSTTAKVLAAELNCIGTNLQEINCATDRGIDMVRGLESCVGMFPMGGKSRVWILEEVHCLTKEGQSALLLILENLKKFAYFILASTDPQKLLPTIRSRCSPFLFQPVPGKLIAGLVRSVAEKEEVAATEVVIDAIVTAADGSARTALQLLERAAEHKTEPEQLVAVMKGDVKRQSIELMRMLVERRSKWKEVSAVLKSLDITNATAEGFRQQMLAYAAACMLNGKDPGNQSLVISALDYDYMLYKAGLVNACYEITKGR